MNADGENTIIVVPGANGTLTTDHVTLARDVVLSADVLLLQLEIPMAVVEAAADHRARRRPHGDPQRGACRHPS